MHLAALSGLAIAQPLYDLIGRHATFLIAHGAGPGAVLALAAVLSLGVPLALALIVNGVSLISARGARRLQVALVALLGGALAAIALRGQPTLVAVTGSAVAAGVLGAAYRAEGVRTFLSILSPAALLFPVLFLTTTPAARLLWPSAAAGAGSTFGARPPLVIVVFDELSTFDLLDRNGRIDATRFPHFAGLAETAAWFPNATAADPFTARALPALVTGRMPVPGDERLPFAADHPDNLFTWLAASYEMRVEEPMTQLCPRELCSEARTLNATAFARDITVLYLHLVVPADAAAGRLPSLGLGWAGFGEPSSTEAPRDWNVEQAFADSLDRTRPQRFRDAGGAIRGPSRAVLYFVHSLLPHDPYVYRATGTSYVTPGITDGLTLGGRWLDDPWVVEAAHERHIEQARAADALLGELVVRLRADGLFDDALVVVTADHGGSFLPGDMHRWPTAASYVQIAAAPLLVKRPGQTSGAIDPRPASGIDIAPTVAGVLGTPLPWPHDGTSLFADHFPDRTSIGFEEYGLTPQPRVDVREEARRLASIPRAAAAYQPLVGQPIAALPVTSSDGPLRVFSTAFDDFADAGQHTGMVPSFVRGRVEGAGADPIVIAIAIDGTIQGVTRTFPWYQASHHFAALLPPPVHDGSPRQLELFAVGGTSGDWRLTPTSSDVTARLRLASTASGEALVSRRGLEISVEPGAAGQVDRMDLTEATLTLHGWAAGPGGRSAARSIVVMAGSRSVAAAAPADERPDVSAALGLPPGTPITFAVAVPIAEVALGLRLFAVGERTAAEIAIPSNLKAQLAQIGRQ